MLKLIRHPHFVGTLCLCLAMIVSITFLAPTLSNPENHSRTLNIIKESKEQATALSLTVTLASTAITMLPDDYGSAIANELSELSTPLLVIVCILFFEQYLLTAMESLAFCILIPIACVFLIAGLHAQRNSLRIIGYKILLIAILCAVVIPLSAGLTETIRAAFANTSASINAQLNGISEIFEDLLNAKDVWKFLSSLKEGISEALSFAKEALGLLIDAVAILLITSCVIPVITVILFIWAVKSTITGHIGNLEDAAMSVLSKLSSNKKNEPLPLDLPDDDGDTEMSA